MARTKVVINNRIRTLRFEHAEMTQQDLAEKIGVSRQTVNAIEGGKYSPSLDVAFQIARVFDKPMDEVFQCEIRRGQTGRKRGCSRKGSKE